MQGVQTSVQHVGSTNSSREHFQAVDKGCTSVVDAIGNVLQLHK